MSIDSVTNVGTGSHVKTTYTNLFFNIFTMQTLAMLTLLQQLQQVELAWGFMCVSPHLCTAITCLIVGN